MHGPTWICWANLTPFSPQPPCGNGTWEGHWYSGAELAGEEAGVECTATPDIMYNFVVPLYGLREQFSVRWTKAVPLRRDDFWMANMHTDDGVRLLVDGEVALDHWDECCQNFLGGFMLAEGDHKLTVEFYQGPGLAYARVGVWATNTAADLARCDGGEFMGRYFASKDDWHVLDHAGADAVIDAECDRGGVGPDGSGQMPLAHNFDDGHMGGVVDLISARWTGAFRFGASSDTTGSAAADVVFRLRADGAPSHVPARRQPLQPPART